MLSSNLIYPQVACKLERWRVPSLMDHILDANDCPRSLTYLGYIIITKLL